MSYVLIVGDGNFSFSLSLCQVWTRDIIIATCFQDRDSLERQYDHTVEDTICALQEKGVKVLYNIDGTSLESYCELKDNYYRCVIFNFPHAGGKNNIKKNKDLVQGFLRSSAKLLDPVVGEIWVTLCRGQGGTPLEEETVHKRGYNNSWKIVELAAECQLILAEIKPFQDWAGYMPSGYRGNNKSFDTRGAITHIFTKERINKTAWTISQAPPITPDTVNVSLCKYCCHGNEDTGIALMPTDLINYECFEYSLLEQDWHPLTVVRNEIMKLLSHSLSPLSNSILSSFLPIIHKTAISDTHRPIELIPTINSDYHYVMEHSLSDRVMSLLRKDSTVLLSSSVYPKVSDISSCNDQPIVHQLMALLPIINHTVPLGTIVSDILKEYLSSDLHWINEDKRGNSKSLMLCINEGHEMISLAQLFSVEIKPECALETSSTSVNPTCISINPCISMKLPSSATVRYVIINLDTVTAYKYNITDVRSFWSKDSRFHTQFTSCHSSQKYHPFSLFPPQYIHDVSFWVGSEIPQEIVTCNLLHQVRTIAGLNILSVQCIDTYIPSSSDTISYCYRLVYGSHDRGLGRESVGQMQEKIRSAIECTLKWKLR